VNQDQTLTNKNTCSDGSTLDTSGNLYSVSNDFDIINHDPKRKQIVGGNLSYEIWTRKELHLFCDYPCTKMNYFRLKLILVVCCGVSRRGS